MVTETGGLETVDLGDPRRARRLAHLVDALVAQPAASLPQACGDEAALKAAYRFFRNGAIDPAAITAVSIQATVDRCPGRGRVLAIQDTTSLDYTSHAATRDLGPLENAARRGLFVHSTLAVTAQGVPLGILDRQVWARDPATSGKRHQRHALPIEAKESAKWLRALRGTEERLGAAVAVVTVADREADIFEVVALGQVLRGDWLIRARHNRKLVGELALLVQTVEAAPVQDRRVQDLPRGDQRAARQAMLSIRAVTVELRPPRRPVQVLAEWWAAHPTAEHLAPTPLPPVRVGVILVTEEAPPAGVEPVRWLLLTSLPIETPEQVTTAVGYYRLRWLIERYHFLLKSGYGVERLQLNEAERLDRALAVFGEAAWRLLWLTYQARRQPTAPCTIALTAEEARVVGALGPPRNAPADPLPLLTAVRIIAQLGGFLGRKGDGDPGVKTIWRGWRRLQDMVRGYRLHLTHPNLLAFDDPTCVQR